MGDDERKAGFVKTLYLGFMTVTVEKRMLGKDILITVTGGEEHIGCTVLSVPRPSLLKDGQISCTSSVINVTGHKDEFICRSLAEKTAKKYNRVTVCTGGIHLDDISKEQIQKLIEEIESIEL